MEHTIGSIDQRNQPTKPVTLSAQGKPLTLPVFQHVHENARFYRIMLGHHSPAAFMLRLMDYLAANSYEKHAPLHAMARLQTIEPHYTARFLAGALVGLMIWWLENDLPRTPEQMAYDFSQLAAPGVLAVLGLD